MRNCNCYINDEKTLVGLLLGFPSFLLYLLKINIIKTISYIYQSDDTRHMSVVKTVRLRECDAICEIM